MPKLVRLSQKNKGARSELVAGLIAKSVKSRSVNCTLPLASRGDVLCFLCCDR